MSIERDCYSCRLGNHDKHDPNWGTIPNLIGGQHCGCAGDCFERHEAARVEFARIWEFGQPSIRKADGPLDVCERHEAEAHGLHSSAVCTCPSLASADWLAGDER